MANNQWQHPGTQSLPSQTVSPVPVFGSPRILNTPSSISKQEKNTASRRLNRMPTLHQETPRPKRLTQCRREVLIQFLEDNKSNPLRFGEIGGRTWIIELISRLRRRNGSTGNVTISDAISWLNIPEIATLIGAIPRAGSGRSSRPANVSPPEIIQPCGSRSQFVSTGKNMQDGQKRNSTILPNPLHCSKSMPDLSPQFNSCSEEKERAVNAGNSSTTRTYAEATNAESFRDFSLPDEYQKQLFKGAMIPLSDVQVLVNAGGFIIHLPASTTPTTVFLQPTTWSAFKCNQTSDEFNAMNDEIQDETQYNVDFIKTERPDEVDENASVQQQFSEEQNSTDTSSNGRISNGDGEIAEEASFPNLVFVNVEINNEEMTDSQFKDPETVDVQMKEYAETDSGLPNNMGPMENGAISGKSV